MYLLSIVYTVNCSQLWIFERCSTESVRSLEEVNSSVGDECGTYILFSPYSLIELISSPKNSLSFDNIQLLNHFFFVSIVGKKSVELCSYSSVTIRTIGMQ